MKSEVIELKKVLEKKAWELESLREARQSLGSEVEYLESRLSLLSRASIFFQFVFEKKKDELRVKFEKAVNYGLERIFGPDTRLKIEQQVKGNRICNDIKVEKRFGEQWKVLDIIDDDGGGLVDVVSLLLRVLVIVLMMPQPRRLLILDEAMKMLSMGHRAAVAMFMRELCDKLGMQIILVTHMTELSAVADVVYKIEKGGLISCEHPLKSDGMNKV